MTRGTAMLWYKAWRESRGRFVVCAAVIVGLCAVFLVFEDVFRQHMRGGMRHIDYVHVRIYGGVVRAMFTLLAIVLAMGGLRREAAHGTAGFTLSLPVSRGAHVRARAGVGLVELVVLAWLPAVVVPGLSAVLGEPYPWGQAAGFAALWTAGGAVVFAMSFLGSSLVGGLTALTLSVVVLRLHPLVVARLASANGGPVQLGDVMSGRHMAYFDPAAALLVGPVPWAILGGAAALAFALLAIAARVTARGRFA